MAHKAKFNSMLYRREKLKTQQSEKAKNEGMHTYEANDNKRTGTETPTPE